MKIDLSFEYDVSFVQKGYRTPHDVKSSATAALAIRDVAIEDAETVFAVGQQVRLNHLEDRFQMIDGRVPRVVAFGGQTYLETCRVEDIVEVFSRPPRANQGNPMDVTGLDAHPRHSDGPLPPPASPAEVVAGFKSGSREIRVWNDDGGLTRRERMQKRCNDMIVADGHLFVLVNEPVLVVSEIQTDEDAVANGCAVGDVILMLGEASLDTGNGYCANFASGHNTSSRRFRLDRQDEAKAFAQGLAERQGKKFVNFVRSEFVSGRPLNFDEEAEAVIRTVSATVFALQEAVSQLPRKLAVAWAALREASDGAATDTVTPQMIDALRSTHAALLDPAVGGWGVTHNPYVFRGGGVWGEPALQIYGMGAAGATIRALRALVDDAVTRWNARPAQADWLDAALPVQAVRGAGFEVFEILSLENANAAAQTLHADLSELIDVARAGAGHLVGVVDNGRMAVGLLSNELEPLTLLGSYGVEKVLPALRERVQTFCQRNIDRQLEMAAENDLGFVPTLG